ncbi:MAG: nuclear transport factor 2 family protein [Pyrinomonadaceae bacterium]
MNKALICILLCAAAAVTASAQRSPDTAAAMEVVNRLFDAMKAKNADAIKAVFAADGQLVAIDKPKDGKGISKTRLFTADAFASMISGAKGGDLIEKMISPDVRVWGDMAVVTGRYTFYVGDKFSHCGANTFNLVRTGTGWMILNGASTLEFQCERDLAAIDVPVINADPKDVSTIDGIMKAFYATISGGKGVPRQWARDATLYTPRAYFVGMGEQDGKIRVGMMTKQQYVNGNNASLISEGFWEREINRVVHRFGNLAHVFSVYEYTTETKPEKVRGVNSLELHWDGTRWWISAVSWDEERPNNPIPKDLLKGKK